MYYQRDSEMRLWRKQDHIIQLTSKLDRRVSSLVVSSPSSGWSESANPIGCFQTVRFPLVSSSPLPLTLHTLITSLAGSNNVISITTYSQTIFQSLFTDQLLSARWGHLTFPWDVTILVFTVYSELTPQRKAGLIVNIEKVIYVPTSEQWLCFILYPSCPPISSGIHLD